MNSAGTEDGKTRSGIINSPLTPEEQQRYARQIGVGVFTEEQQLRLKQSTVLITRVGGMGGPAAQMLTMAGVGNVIIAHGGKLIEPDLNRQVLGSEAGLGELRAPAFAEYLRSLNRFVQVEALSFEPSDAQAAELAERCDLFVSCPPTFAERLRLARAAVQAGIPIIDAAQWGMTGTLYCSRAKVDPCLACLYPSEPPFEEFFPVVGAISSAIGSLAALEGVKILTGAGQVMWGQMFTYDGFTANIAKLNTSAPLQPCPVCGQQQAG